MPIIHTSNKTNSKFFTTINIPKKYSMKSIFTSNVFYKPHTNTHVSTSVSNSRIISRKT